MRKINNITFLNTFTTKYGSQEETFLLHSITKIPLFADAMQIFRQAISVFLCVAMQKCYLSLVAKEKKPFQAICKFQTQEKIN